MKVTDRKVLTVGRFGVIAMRDVKDVQYNILFHHKPRTTTEAHTLTLSDGMEPESLVLTDTFTRLQFYYFTRLFTQIPTDIVVIVNLAQETDTL